MEGWKCFSLSEPGFMAFSGLEDFQECRGHIFGFYDKIHFFYNL